MKRTVGKDWLEATNMTTVLKTLARRGHDEWAGKEAWQPDEGNLLFSAESLAERVMDKAHQVLAEQIAEDPKLAEQIDPKLREEVADVLRSMTLMGGPKYQLVVDSELASTLRSFRDEHLTSDVNTVLRQVTRAWKTMMTVFPTKILKYNIRNISGDADHANAAMGWKAFKPRDIGAAAKELWNVAFNGQKASQLYDDAQQDAVLDSGYSLEVWLGQKQGIDEALSKLDEGAKKSTLAAMDNAWRMLQSPATDAARTAGGTGKVKRAWHTLQQVNNWRENVMRYVVYKKIREHIDTVTKTDGKPQMEVTPANIDKVFEKIGYGPANRAIIRGQESWRAVAAYYSRETLGDYGNLSTAGRKLRALGIPFFSWQEINFKFYRRMVANIGWHYSSAGKVATPEARAAMARVGALAGKKAAAMMVGRAFQFFVLMHAWNHLMFPDEEEELTDTDQRRGHLILGKIGDEILMLPTPGALSDVARWMGYEDALAALDHVQSGRGDMGDVAEAIGTGFLNTALQGVNPIFKMPLELITGMDSFPDVTTPRRLRSRMHHVIRGVGLDVPLDLFGAITETGRPTQGAFHLLANLAVDKRPTDYAAYSQIRSLAYQYKSHTSGETVFLGPMTPQAEAYYNYRLALRYDDEAARDRWRARMDELGISGKDRRAMLDRSKPLGMLSKAQRRAFRDTLTPHEQRVLERADQYWRDTFLGQ